MKIAWLALSVSIAAIGIARAQTPVILLQQYNCYICHADNKTKTGPAYVDVAARYRGNPKAVSMIAAAIKKGDHGYGPWHMPPHPEVSGADARKMARYILSLGK